MPKKSQPTALKFEEALKQLEAVVAQLESKDLPLEESLQAYERGMALSQQCQTLLEQAEQKVKILTEKGTLKDFQETSDADDA